MKTSRTTSECASIIVSIVMALVPDSGIAFPRGDDDSLRCPPALPPSLSLSLSSAFRLATSTLCSKSDVWSAGCILYELAAQHHAFEANSITALVKKITKGTYEDIPAGYSAELRGLISAMLQLKTQSRPAFLTLIQRPFLQPSIH